jgi:predicted DNA-binding transcriptional regulator AlpA
VKNLTFEQRIAWLEAEVSKLKARLEKAETPTERNSDHRAVTRARLRIKDLRDRFLVHDVTIWRWIRDKEFPTPHYIGSRRYWYADEIEGWDGGTL